MKNKMVIGIDPDSDRSGVAIYKNGLLFELMSLELFDLFVCIEKNARKFDLIVSIEDLLACSSSAFNQRAGQKRVVLNKVSESVGRCKQVQFEIMRFCERQGVEVRKHRVSKSWKKGNEFQLFTGWQQSGNEDTRSAAYFGFLETENFFKKKVNLRLT